MNGFIRFDSIDEQLPLMGANVDVLAAVLDLYEFRLGISLEFLGQFPQRGQPRTGVLERALKTPGGHDVQGHWHDGRRDPDMDVTAVKMVILNAHNPFVEGVGAGYRHRAAET